MPNLRASAKKVRQAEKHAIHNRSIRSATRTHVRRFIEAAQGADVEKARGELALAFKRLDKTAKTHIFHRNFVRRKKSALQRKFNEMIKRGAVPAPAPAAT